jgi:hypothetical protein
MLNCCCCEWIYYSNMLTISQAGGNPNIIIQFARPIIKLASSNLHLHRLGSLAYLPCNDKLDINNLSLFMIKASADLSHCTCRLYDKLGGDCF